jgi:hypothetical protein
MSDLIAVVRQLIQDETAPYSLSDETVQGVLDRHNQRILRHRLQPAYADPSDGLSYWFEAAAGFWETRDSELVLKDAEGTELAVSESDLIKGLWELTTGVDKAVWLYDGYTYDVYSAAVECLKLLMAQIKDEYTFSSDEGNFSRSDRVGHLEKLITQYRRNSRPFVLRSAE